jgi:hypothetical protein
MDIPAKLLQPVQKRRNIALALPIILGETHQHADPSHSLGLLRARR